MMAVIYIIALSTNETGKEMIKNISKEEIARLRQPCKNRNILLIDNEDGTITINNSKFGLNSDAENYLMDLPRTDI
jgi:hypothetical protein